MQKCVLVVEDDNLQCNLMTMFLGWHDYEVQTAADGMDAIRKCVSGAFSLVLMDYRLPIVDGHSAARLIKDLTRDKGFPHIIALTATPDQLRADEADTDTIFAAVEGKPWDPCTLLQTIDKVENSGEAAQLACGTHGRITTRLAPDLSREIELLDGRRPPGPLRVLIVEDDDFVRSLLSAALRAERYEVGAVGNGLEAIIALEHGHYDIAVMDYRLPKIDGFVAAQLMGDLLPQVQRPRLIAFTATPELLRERDTSVACRFDEIVPKSSDMRFVIAAIERSVEKEAVLF